MKRMLITGATGFIGANLVKHYIGRYDLHIIIRESSDTWRIKDDLPRVTTHYADITDRDAVIAIVGSIRPDIIVHSAIYGGYPSQKDQDRIIAINLLGTMNLVNACVKNPFECFINTGSSSEYGTKTHAMREDDLLEPMTDYGVSKAAATLFCQRVARSEDLPITTLRLFSPYGPYEERGRLVSDVVDAYLKGKPPVLSSPDFLRDFIFIDDVMAAYDTIIANTQKAKGRIYNVCNAQERRIAEVVACVKEITGSHIDPVYTGGGRPYEATHWQGENANLKTLGWVPRHTLREGLAKTIDAKSKYD